MSNAEQTTSQAAPGATPQARWRDVWQLPALAGSVVFLIGGLVAAVLTAPKPDPGTFLETAVHQVDTKAFSQALDTLNAKVLPLLADPKADPELRRQFHLLRARALYLGQKELGISREENNRAIVSEYETAERNHATLDDRDVSFLADTLVSLEEFDGAAVRIGALPESFSERKTELLKRMIESCLRHTEKHASRALDFITLLTADPAISADDRLWALSRQTTVLTAQGFAEEAIAKVLRTLPRLENQTPTLMGEVLVALARAYIAENETREAAKHLERAAGLLGDESELVATVALLSAEIDHRHQNLESAAERYSTVLNRYSFSEERIAALLGLAEVKAESVNTQESRASDLGPVADEDQLLAESLEHYTELVDHLLAGAEDTNVAPADVCRSLLVRFHERFDRTPRDYVRAMQFADLAERLFTPETVPAELLMALAQVHRGHAEEMLRSAGGGDILSLADADPATQREARTHLIQAGGYFRAHADRVVESDSDAYGMSLWAAADAFDRAGDLDASIAAFQQFSNDFPGDQRVAEAKFRLAQAYQARGDLELAAGIYREQIAGGARGEFADGSYVPLAQAILADGEPANDGEAEQLLSAVIGGAVGGTATPTFRAALRELGQLYYRSGQYPRAIERLEEYLEREESDRSAGNAPGRPVADFSLTVTSAETIDATRYKLADSCRLSAAAIEETLGSGAMPDGERRELEATRLERLKRAAELFERVRRDLESNRHRTALEDLYLRNSYFYLGDCAFDQRDYETAVRQYDAARERYPRDPATLVALTQIVSAHLAMGDVSKAAVANTRAKRFFESLPESVWEDPTLPMTRADWEHWLDSQSKLAQLAGLDGGDSAPE